MSWTTSTHIRRSTKFSRRPKETIAFHHQTQTHSLRKDVIANAADTVEVSEPKAAPEKNTHFEPQYSSSSLEPVHSVGTDVDADAVGAVESADSGAIILEKEGKGKPFPIF